MPRRKAVEGVLRNFLGTYISRCSDYCGYWLFGFLVSERFKAEFDLLNPGRGDSETPLVFAEQLAATKFEDQLRKAGLDLSMVQEARLTISSSIDVTKASVHGHPGPVFNVSFRAWAVMVDGRPCECEHSAIVAPHDPRVESCSTRGG